MSTIRRNPLFTENIIAALPTSYGAAVFHISRVVSDYDEFNVNSGKGRVYSRLRGARFSNKFTRTDFARRNRLASTSAASRIPTII